MKHTIKQQTVEEGLLCSIDIPIEPWNWVNLNGGNQNISLGEFSFGYEVQRLVFTVDVRPRSMCHGGSPLHVVTLTSSLRPTGGRWHDAADVQWFLSVQNSGQRRSSQLPGASKRLNAGGSPSEEHGLSSPQSCEADQTADSGEQPETVSGLQVHPDGAERTTDPVWGHRSEPVLTGGAAGRTWRMQWGGMKIRAGLKPPEQKPCQLVLREQNLRGFQAPLFVSNLTPLTRRLVQNIPASP